MHPRFSILYLLLSFIPMLGFAKDPLAVGAPAPAITVTVDSGASLDLAALYARGPVLFYFYPKSFTPGCTAQACNLRDHFDAIREAGITVIGVSRDKVAKQAEFREKYDLPFALVADPEGILGAAFGLGSRLGLAYLRQSFLVVNGQVAWVDLSATPKSQSEDVLAALATLKVD